VVVERFGAPRGIGRRHPAALTDPYQIGAAAELVYNNVEEAHFSGLAERQSVTNTFLSPASNA
jgi:hypothetical protein